MKLIAILSAVFILFSCKTPNADMTDSVVKESYEDAQSYCQSWAREQAGRGFGWRVRYSNYYEQCMEQYSNNNSGGGSSGSESDSLLFVAINGRSSCRIPGAPDRLYMYNPLRQLAKDMKGKGIGSDSLHFCLYASDLRITPDKMRVKMFYHQGGRARDMGEGLLPRNRIFVKDIPALINKFADGRKVVIIGHSYGGWVALRTVLNDTDYYGRTVFQTKALYTIDPISPFDCDIGAFLASDPANNRSACRQFPSDIDGDDVDRKTEFWLNLFQRQGKIASHQASGPLNSYHFLDSEECAHRYLGANRVVWNIINSSLGELMSSGRVSDANGMVGRYDGDPEAGTGGECGALTDSGETWEDPGTESSRF